MKTSELKNAALDWAVAKCENLLHDDGSVSDYWQPSELWEQGGAIIERERIQLRPMRGTEWEAYWGLAKEGCGTTPLIAAMRCYVASKLGNEVEIPKEMHDASY